MASQKNESEGIALLSIYGDVDDEMEDVGVNEGEEEAERPQSDARTNNYEVTTEIYAEEEIRAFEPSDFSKEATPSGVRQQQQPTPVRTDGFTPKLSTSTTTTPQRFFASPQLQQQQQIVPDLNSSRSQTGRLTIVDYGHDEAAMSPEPEEGEIEATGRVRYTEELQAAYDVQERFTPGRVQVLTPSTQATPQLSEPQDQPDISTNYAVSEVGYADTMDAATVGGEENKEVDPLDKFLPPPPATKCSDELQEKIRKFLLLKKSSGKSFNAEVRNKKEYRNPDFLLHAVTYQDIDQIGSCFSKDVFDPHGYDKSDFYDEIEADMKREMDRKEQERKRSQKVEFTSGGTQSATVAAAAAVAAKFNAQIPGIPPPAGGLNTALAAADVPRDGRQNKKSKWDKVDGDRKDPVSAAGLLTAAYAGTGYSAFAQQRRKEAEDRRSSDRKSDRRS